MKSARLLHTLLLWSLTHTCIAAEADAALPPGVKAVWNLDQAFHETNAARERVCLNGLWRWQPLQDSRSEVPDGKWGFFKVPGCWPGIGDYMQTDSQTVFPHPAWKKEKPDAISSAWYQREITVPAAWAGRRIVLRTEYLNSFAAVFVDGKRIGEISFPAGEVDLGASCRPGEKHLLSLCVDALPLKGVMLSYIDTAAARQVKGSVNRRGLCGDVYLESSPAGACIGALRVATSVRNGELRLDSTLDRLAADAQYVLRATVRDGEKTLRQFTSKPFGNADLKEGRFAFGDAWKAASLWDIHTPGNMLELDLELLDAAGNACDRLLPVRFGFREFWIDGRDFYLNGSRIFLSCVPFDNAHISAATATYAAAKETFSRLKSFGINCVYAHNYDCEPGSHLSFDEILRAADDAGMLFALTQPHFSHYDWKSPDAEAKNGYARHAAFYARVAGNHPSVVFYAMSHNATGYNEDMNPDMIDGKNDARENWSLNNSKLALRAEALVRKIDPDRIVYHHASGNLGAIHNSNFYLNFAPIQEVSDWFEHWATAGIKPAYTCEYGVPFTWDWTMYRGWYKGERNFGSAKVPWEFCFAEWNSQFLGDRAFDISPMEKKNLRWEAQQFRDGGTWYRWDYPYEIGSNLFDDRNTVLARYTTDNWRAFRTWGLSGNSPWEYGHFWRLRDGVKKARRELPVDWDSLQKPGYSPDYIEPHFDRLDLSYALEDWVPTAAASALLRSNRPLLMYIAGKPAAFTSKDHNAVAGETIEKQIVVVNNSRETVSGTCDWTLNLPLAMKGTLKIRVATGEQARLPLSRTLPEGLPAGRYELNATMKFSNGETQSDTFTFNVLAPIQPAPIPRAFALFDPKGETATLLERLGVSFQSVAANADLSTFDVLIVGKGALSVGGITPDAAHLRNGARVVLFEQTAEVLEKRFGFRVAEYGLRQAFARIPDHPLLQGLDDEALRDWRGEATTLAPRLKYELNPRFNGAPSVKWCDIDVTRVWRCGNHGNVASVLIEKPARGDCLPVLDGGYSLQYTPLLECREGESLLLFCQADVCGRTENDPAALHLARNILRYAAAWKPSERKQVLYAGNAAGKNFFEKCGLALTHYGGGPLPANAVLIAAPGCADTLRAQAPAVEAFVKAGGALLALGLTADEANAFLPEKVATKNGEHIAAYFPAQKNASFARGVSPADVHNRDVREFPLLTGGAEALGDGIVAKSEHANVIFCQMTPWTFDYSKQYNVKRTYRRAAFLVARLLANLGAAAPTPLMQRLSAPLDANKNEKRWLDGLYLDTPEEMDDPYRFFRW
jgi:beta-galactosidase